MGGDARAGSPTAATLSRGTGPRGSCKECPEPPLAPVLMALRGLHPHLGKHCPSWKWLPWAAGGAANASCLLGQLTVTSLPTVTPAAAAPAPDPLSALTSLVLTQVTSSSVHLSWSPAPKPPLKHLIVWRPSKGGIPREVRAGPCLHPQSQGPPWPSQCGLSRVGVALPSLQPPQSQTLRAPSGGRSRPEHAGTHL